MKDGRFLKDVEVLIEEIPARLPDYPRLSPRISGSTAGMTVVGGNDEMERP